MFWNLVMTVFQPFWQLWYRVKRAEYIHYGLFNEYFIIYKESRIPFLLGHTNEVKCSYGYGDMFLRVAEKLLSQGVAVEEKFLSFEEFETFAKTHPVLKNRPEIKAEVDKETARRILEEIEREV